MNDESGIRLGRYEKENITGRGDQYKEFYSGFNIFFYGHKLKWQLEYNTPSWLIWLMMVGVQLLAYVYLGELSIY